jgi:TonB family protein
MIKSSFQKGVLMLVGGWRSLAAYRFFAMLSFVESRHYIPKSPYFWLVVFGHLLLLTLLTCSLSFSFTHDPPEADEQKGTTVPAYIYHDENPPVAQRLKSQRSMQSTPVASAASAQESAKNGIYKPQVQAKKSSAQSVAIAEEESNPATVAIPTLVSDNKIKKSLLKLLSKATAAKLFYPRSASDFNIKGTVKIRFLLFPGGGVTEVTLLESSGSGVLDNAALTTIRSISPVKDVDLFLQKSEYVEVGIIYR